MYKRQIHCWVENSRFYTKPFAEAVVYKPSNRGMSEVSELGIWLDESFAKVCDDIIMIVHHDTERLTNNQRWPHNDVPPLRSVLCLYAAANDRQWNLTINNTLRVTIKVLWKGSSDLTFLNFRFFISPSGQTWFGSKLWYF